MKPGRRAFLRAGLITGAAALIRPGRLWAVSAEEVVARATPVMGTMVEVIVGHLDRRISIQAAEKALDVCRGIDRHLSHFLLSSDLGNLASAETSWVDISPDFARVYPEALRLHRQTAGTFDPAAGALVKLWKDAAVSGSTPSATAVSRVSCGAELVEYDEANRRARFHDRGIRLDFGAIGKGYAADRMIETLSSEGIENAIVAVGGDVRKLGLAPIAEIAIQHPLDPDLVLASIDLGENAISTSGDYEQGLRLGRRQRSHLIDPRTREPVKAPPLSVSVIAPAGMLADGLSSSAFLLGARQGVELVMKTPGCEALVVDSSLPGGYLATPGFERRIRGNIHL